MDLISRQFGIEDLDLAIVGSRACDRFLRTWIERELKWISSRISADRCNFRAVETVQVCHCAAVRPSSDIDPPAIDFAGCFDRRDEVIDSGGIDGFWVAFCPPNGPPPPI